MKAFAEHTVNIVPSASITMAQRARVRDKVREVMTLT
jgi:hypothetical protein